MTLKNEIVMEAIKMKKKRIKKPADFTCSPRLRSKTGKEQFRFSDENKHFL